MHVLRKRKKVEDGLSSTIQSEDFQKDGVLMEYFEIP